MTLPTDVTGTQQGLDGEPTVVQDGTNVTAVIRVVDAKDVAKDTDVPQDVEKPKEAEAKRGGKKRRNLTNRALYPNKSVKANSGKSDGTFTSKFRGVTKHRLTQRFEAHFWDSSYERPKSKSGKRRKGRQVYLGGYITEEDAARAYDKAAIAYIGSNATLNFPVEEYQDHINENKEKSAEEVVSELRRNSVGFARGSSQYRGVTKNKKCLRWEARIGKVVGNKYLYLGIFDDPKLAAIAYDKAAVKFFGTRAMTNFRLQDYQSILDDPDSHRVPLHGESHDDPVEKEDTKNTVEDKPAPQQVAVQTMPHSTHAMQLPSYEEQVAWYHNQLKSMQIPQHQVHIPAIQNRNMGYVQPYATMTYDFEGNRSGNPHQPHGSSEQNRFAIDMSHLSPLAASLLSPLGIPKEPHSRGTAATGQQDLKIDSVSADALRAMVAPPSPFTQAYTSQGFDLDSLGWIDTVDMDQIAMMLKTASSPKPGSAKNHK